MTAPVAPRIVAGVDVAQWRALVAVTIKGELRGAGAGLGLAGRQRHGWTALAMLLVFDLLLGAMLGLFIVISGNPFTATTLYVTLLMFSVGSSILLDFQTLVVAPQDYIRLAPYPISARTFFAARLTTLVAYVTAIALAIGAFPLLGLFVVGGFSLTRAAAASSPPCSRPSPSHLPSSRCTGQ